MALTYTEAAQLMGDPVFTDRVKVAILKYSDFILNEAPGTPAHSTRYRWAQNATANPISVAQSITPPVVMDGQVQTDGAAITDEALQTTVETTVNRLL